MVGGASDEEILNNTTTDEFYNFFKKQNSKNLPKYIDICLRFGRFQNSSDEYKSIAKKAEAALKRIGLENQLNKIRVQRFGVQVEDE